MLDNGGGREEILAATGAVIGVTGASIDVAEGEICVLMGLSGSGKSTLLRAVNGLNKVTRGSILVRDGDNAVDMANCSATDLRRMRTVALPWCFSNLPCCPGEPLPKMSAWVLNYAAWKRASGTPSFRKNCGW